MKNSNPVVIVLVGGLIIFGLTGLLLILVQLITPISLIAILFISLFSAVFSFIVYYFLFKKFIHTRLSILYRSIRKSKMSEASNFQMSMSTDIIGQAEKDTRRWANEKQTEIVQLQEQDKFRREFLGNLAHELKTPVFSIQGYVLTLLEGGLEDDTVNRVFLERAAKAIDRMTSILEDLDELTKLEVNELKLEMRPFDIRELVKEVMESFEMKASDKGIKVHFAKENFKEKMVLADRGKIAQVVTNLIGNSIAYGNENGDVVVRFYEVDDIITVEISDNGPGIEPNHIPRLFERFYRVEKSRNRNEGGSGLGLSIVKHILDSHNQTISVRSTIGVGSTFTFSLDRYKGGPNSFITSRGITVN